MDVIFLCDLFSMQMTILQIQSFLLFFKIMSLFYLSYLTLSYIPDFLFNDLNLLPPF